MHGNLKKKKNWNQILFTNFNKYVSQKTKKKTFNNKSYKPQNLTVHEHILKIVVHEHILT